MNRLKRKSINRIFLRTLVLGIPLFASVASLAWFSDTTKTRVSMNSVVHGQYFENGDGSSAAPFEIARPNQLYYLAWLQEMGYFNMLDEDNSNTIKQTYFLLTEDLNMEDFVLPPIGTATYPFIGHFEGQGHTISNLTVSNANYTDNPHSNGVLNDGVEIVGFFGVIGTLNDPSNSDGTYATSDYKVSARIEDSEGNASPSTTKYSYTNSVVSVSNFYIDGAKIKTQTTNTLIGIAAGYVNGTLSGIGVKNSNIAIKQGSRPLTYSDNLSDYSLVGYCRDDYIHEETLDPRESAGISVPGGVEDVIIEDAGNQWGGSVDMKTMYDNVLYIKKNKATRVSASNNPQYVKTETRTIDEVNDTDSITNRTYAGLNGVQYDSSAKFYSQAGLGNFYYGYDDTDLYLYMNGANTSKSPKTRITYTYKDQMTTAFYISDGTNYLTLNSSHNGVTNQTSQANATKWIIDSSNHIYTTVECEPYYLNGSGDGFSISETGSTSWTKTSNSIYGSSTINSVSITFYIFYDNGWKCLPTNYYYISDGNGNYLSLDSTTTITNQTSQANATKWFFSNTANLQGYILGYYNGTATRLYISSSRLIASTTNGTSFTNNGTYLYNNTNRIVFSADKVWTLASSLGTYYTISYNGNYLSNNGTSIANATNAANATKWKFSNPGANPDGDVTVIYNSTPYYLRIRSSQLTLTTSHYSTTNSSGKLKNSSDYYVRYNNGWTGTNKANNGTVLTFTEAGSDVYGTVSSFSNTISPLTFVSTTKQVETKDVTTMVGGVPTYFPLAMDRDSSNNFSTNAANTGYVVSGGMTGHGDIRISQYNISSIGNSYTSGQNDFLKNGNNYKIHTINGSGDHEITPTEVNNFEKFTDSKEDLIPVLKSKSYVYGLHFMKTSISKDRLCEAEQVTINNVTYNESGKKYELPIDCIDFNLNSKGYVNFFAGTYYSNNLSFFTLHKIFRDESGYKITDIKEISEIYKSSDDSEPFIYKYTDGTYSETLTSSYSLKFKTDWIKTQSSLTTDAVYYYEIPINEGEYALGSDPGSSGSYLLYLDISANKQMAKRTYNIDTTITTTDTVRTPNGVAFVKDDHNDTSLIDTMDSVNYQLGRVGGTDANPTYYSNATVTNGELSDGANFNRTYDSTLGRDKIEVKNGNNIDTGPVATFIGSYTENDETKIIYANPPGSDGDGNDIPQTPYKREYVSSYAITYSDLNQQTGVNTKTVITCYDTVITYVDGTQIITRYVQFDVYLTLKNETNERHLLSLYTDSIADTEKINFGYSTSSSSNTYYFTLLYNDNTSTTKTLTSHITLMNADGLNYNFKINSNTVSGSPTESSPVDFVTNETLTDFASLFLTREDYDPDNQ